MPKFAFKLGRWYVGIRNRIQWLKTQINDENEIKIMKTVEEMKEFKGTKGEWTINHWAKGECGATYDGEPNGVTHYTGDNVGREVYNIVSDIHPNSHSIEHSFEGAHIAEIAARSEESLANAQLIAAAPDLLEALLSLMDGVANLPPLVVIEGVLKTEWEQGLKAVNKALGK